MEGEIDLKPYLLVLMRHWIWIIGTGVLLAVAVFVLISLRSPSYEAAALVAATEPRQIIELDPRITETNDSPRYRAYPELAISDDLLTALLTELEGKIPELISIGQLRRMLVATPGEDVSLLRLTARYHDPENAALIANTWADLFVIKANEIFGTQGDDQRLFFQFQLEEKEQELSLSEQVLIDFQADNRRVVLENQLSALSAAQAEQLAKLSQTDVLLQDVGSLLEHIESTPLNGDVGNTDPLVTTLLRARAFAGNANGSDTPIPVQIQIDSSQLSEATTAEQVELLTGLQSVLLTQKEQISTRLAEIEPEILAVQQEQQNAMIVENRLQRDFEVAQDTYIALAHKVEEEGITSQDINRGVRLASRSAVPESPSGSNRLPLTIVAGLAGIFAASFVVLLIHSWRQSSTSDV